MINEANQFFIQYSPGFNHLIGADVLLLKPQFSTTRDSGKNVSYFADKMV